LQCNLFARVHLTAANREKRAIASNIFQGGRAGAQHEVRDDATRSVDCARGRIPGEGFHGTVGSRTPSGTLMRSTASAQVVVAAVLAAGSARAPADSHWIPVAQTDESVYLLDEASLEVRSGLLTAWELVEYAGPQQADGVLYRSQLNLRAYRCSDRSWDVLQVTRFAGPRQSGEAVLASSFPPLAAAWNRVAPESVAALMLDRVCTLAGAQARGNAAESSRASS